MPMTRIERHELWDAMDTWRDAHTDPDHYGMNLMQYLGIKTWQEVDTQIEMTADAARRLRMLNGPYAQTVIKAWYAKYPLKKKLRTRP